MCFEVLQKIEHRYSATDFATCHTTQYQGGGAKYGSRSRTKSSYLILPYSIIHRGSETCVPLRVLSTVKDGQK